MNKIVFLTSCFLGIIALLAACSTDGAKPKPGPKLKASIVQNDGKNDGISIKQVLNIAANRSEMRCGELSLGRTHAFLLKSIQNSQLVDADSKTRVIAGAIGVNADKAINEELQCHCDRGEAMPGYEIFERRVHLQKTRKRFNINPALSRFYPRDETGKPRFLEIGEKIDLAILKQLPAPPPFKRFDDCGIQCKASRERTNKTAVAEGRPEPWPNLQHPRKKPCIDGVPQTG